MSFSHKINREEAFNLVRQIVKELAYNANEVKITFSSTGTRTIGIVSGEPDSAEKPQSSEQNMNEATEQ